MHPGILRVLSARRSLSLFLAVVACLAISQVWLTWRLMEQDQNLELERSRQRLEQTAHLALSQLERRIGDWDLALRELKSLPPSAAVLSKVPAGATFILISHSSVLLYPKRPLLFVPEVPVRGESQAHAFDAADELELQEQEYERAIAALQPLLNRPATRAEALLRIARIERKTNRPQAALDAYKRLESEKTVNLSGTPYAVLAANARCQIFTQLGKRENAVHEARSLRDALLEGRWPIPHETFNYYWAELASFGIDVAQPPETSLRTSMLVSELYNRWQSAVRADSITSGRDPTWDSSLLVWNAAPDRLAAMVTPPEWLGPSLGLPADIHWKIVLPGAPAQNAMSVTRSLADAQLPGLIEFFNVPQVSGVAHNRRSLWLAGVVLMLLLVLVSAYAVHRGISQELRVARLQIRLRFSRFARISFSAHDSANYYRAFGAQPNRGRSATQAKLSVSRSRNESSPSSR